MRKDSDTSTRIAVIGRFLAPLLLVLTGLVSAQAIPGEWPHPAELEPEPIEYEAPEPRREQLSNGMIVYLMEDRTLPLVQGVAYVRAPSVYDPAEKSGLAAMTAALLREGGTAELTPSQLDLALERLAASVEASASDVLASVSFNALSDTLDRVMPIWRDVLVEPAFDEERLEVRRQRLVEATRRIVDNPVDLGFREFLFRVTDGHPFGTYATEQTIAAIERADVIDFHRTHYGPANTVLAVTGDFDGDEMLARLERLLGGWRNDTVPPPDLPPLPEPQRQIYLLPRPIGQSVVIVGHPSVRAYTPEYNDLDVVNHILGAGGLNSRLFEEIRTRRGLAYSTGSLLTQGFDWPGIFVAYTISPAQATGSVLELVLAEIGRVREEPVGEQELEIARTSILNSSLFRFVSPAAVTERTARVELLGLEPDYYERYLANLQQVTADELLDVAREHLLPESAVVLVVGDPEVVGELLEPFGEVTVIEPK